MDLLDERTGLTELDCAIDRLDGTARQRLRMGRAPAPHGRG
jgi:hypothetical protein